MSVLVGIGSFGTWSVLQPRRVATYTFNLHHLPVSQGIVNWQGPGWITLGLAFLSAVFVLRAVGIPKSDARVVAVSLMAAVCVVTAYTVIDTVFSYGGSTDLNFSVGWGLWLCFSSAVIGVTIGTFRVRRARISAIG